MPTLAQFTACTHAERLFYGIFSSPHQRVTTDISLYVTENWSCDQQQDQEVVVGEPYVDIWIAIWIPGTTVGQGLLPPTLMQAAYQGCGGGTRVSDLGASADEARELTRYYSMWTAEADASRALKIEGNKLAKHFPPSHR